MALPPDNEGEQSPVTRLVSGLHELLGALRDADFDVGNEQYLAACDLLGDSRLAITEIALEVGFYDHSAFSRKFPR